MSCQTPKIHFIQSSTTPEMKYDIQSVSRIHRSQQFNIYADIPAHQSLNYLTTSKIQVSLQEKKGT